MRDDIPGALDHHRVTDADILALDFVLIVQRRIGDHHTADRDRGEAGDRRQGAGAADLDVDGFQNGGRLFGREFVGDGPARSAGDKARRSCQSSRSAL